MAKIIGKPLANIPWEEGAANSDDIVWRHSNNPIIGWNPIKNVARMFNLCYQCLLSLIIKQV